VRQLPSGRWQARHLTADGLLRAAPCTFDTKLDATAWLDARQWDDEETILLHRPMYRLAVYAERWLEGRELKPRTRAGYRQILDSLIIPTLGQVPLRDLTPTRVRSWYAHLNPTTPARRTHTYLLLHAIMATAVADDLIAANPCRIQAAGKSHRNHQIKVATLAELDVILEEIPARYKAMVLIAAWCGLRFGELTELRRCDVDFEAGLLRVDRGVVLVGHEHVVGVPKSTAGRRTVAIPPHLLPGLRDHLRTHVGVGPSALLFPAGDGRSHMAPSTLYKVWYPARKAAGREDLRFHDLRHTGATFAAGTGATLADLMARLGHSTAGAAMIYQHSTSERDQAIATALSAIAERKVIPLRGRL
jgi:integrase